MPSLNLSQLVDLALGTPEVGAVNFNILHTLLHAMIKQLNISDITANINDADRDFLSGSEKMILLKSLAGDKDSGKEDSEDTQSEKSSSEPRKHRPPYHQLESRVAQLAEQLEQLNALPSTNELFQKIKATGDTGRPTPIADLWQSMQISKRVDANENGVSKLMSMVEDLMREMDFLKDEYSKVEDLMKEMQKLKDENNNLKNRLDNLGLDDLRNKLNNLESLSKDLNNKFGQLPDYSYLPSAEEFAAFVTWPQLEDALSGVRLGFQELMTPIEPKLPSQTTIPSRPNSSRPSTRLSTASSGPTNEILEILERLGKVCGQHDVLERRVEDLEEEMKNKVGLEAFQDALGKLNFEVPDDLLMQLEQLKQDIAELQRELQMNKDKPGKIIVDNDALMRAQKAILKLQGEVETLHKTTEDIIKENDIRTTQIESLFQYSDRLQEGKADKEYVAMEVDVKADKRHLESKVNHSLFESTNAEINRIIKEILDKLSGHELGWKEAIGKLSGEIESKLDRMELESLKEWLESRLKALNQKIKQTSEWADDDAAGLRKQLLQRFHCISCDRPVDMLAAGPVPSIPMNSGMPPTRSPRPYTTFELDQIRQHAKSLVTQEMADFYATERACGGSHTLTYPHKRATKLSHLSHLFKDEPAVAPPAPVAFKHRSEQDLLGVDGHIYKGRMRKQGHPAKTNFSQNTSGVQRGNSPPPSPRLPERPTTSTGVTKPPTTPVPPSGRPRPTSAAPRPSSGASSTRIGSGRLTMRPQSARGASRTGHNSPSPPPEEPQEFLPVEEQTSEQPLSEPVEVPGETPADEGEN